MSAPTYREREAWLEIARRVAEGKWARDGLCSEVITLWEGGLIDTATEARCIARVRAHLGDGVFDPDFDTPTQLRTIYMCNPGLAAPRVLAALFLALESADEDALSASEGVERREDKV